MSAPRPQVRCPGCGRLTAKLYGSAGQPATCWNCPRGLDYISRFQESKAFEVPQPVNRDGVAYIAWARR